MIISFDGNVFSGKTTLARQAGRALGGRVIREHGDFLAAAAPGAYQNRYLSQQVRYLNAEALRIRKLSPDKLNLLDRSFVSLAAHVFALYKMGRSDIRRAFLKRLAEYMRAGRVIIPDFYYAVAVPYETAQARFAAGAKRKRTEPGYIEKDYFNHISYFVSQWIRLAGGTKLDGTDRRSYLAVADRKKRNASLRSGQDEADWIIKNIRRIYFSR